MAQKKLSKQRIVFLTSKPKMYILLKRKIIWINNYVITIFFFSNFLMTGNWGKINNILRSDVSGLALKECPTLLEAQK